jgi:prepilin-type N-terminal cleavage/methylation domain-containing protein
MGVIMKKKAFTLAEMMVVLLILSIVLAAFAPIMTRRSAAGKPYYWRSENNSAQIYYGTAAGNRVNIGQKNDTNDTNARLIINTGDDNQNHILFKRGGTNLLGFLKLDAKDNLRIGGTPLTAMSSPPYGTHNTGIGIGSLQSLSTGLGNTAVGSNALQTNTTGAYNTALGYGTLYLNETGTWNIVLGGASMHNNTTGRRNTVVGGISMYNNTTGDFNTAVGYYSLYRNTTGEYNTALGYQACEDVTGSNKTCIGNNSGPASGSTEASSTDNQMWLGTSETTVYIPGNLTVAGTTTGPSETWTTSDIRLKNVKGENKSGLEKIKQLKVFNYTFKDDKKKTPRVGVMAQDLQKIFPDAVTKDEKGYLHSRMEDMFYALVNAVKELDAKVNEILRCAQNDSKAKDVKIKELNAKNKELEKRIQKLEAILYLND